MATAEPQKWSATLGANADVNTLPATTPAGSGRASTSGLFPPITQQPLDEGGLAPERADFNALFKYLGEYIYYAMQGGVYTYVTTYNYTAGNFVLHERSLYLCIAANGPGSSVKYPTDTAYWRRLALMSDIPSPPTVNNGILTIQKNGSTVATFTANQAGNTTANITVPSPPTVGNGELKINVNGSTVATFTANQTGNSTANITVPAPPTVGNGKITVQASGTTLGSFTVNQGGNSTINIPEATASAFGVVKTDQHDFNVGILQGWVRFRSGIQIVYGAGSDNTPITFLHAFNDPPAVSAICPCTTTGAFACTVARSSTGVTLRVWNAYNNTWSTDGTFTYIAIGTWS